jgi:hypothetical protein
MGAATATVRSKAGAGVRPDELRAALDQALAATDADEVIGPRIRATGLRMRFDLPDAGIVLYVRAGEGEHNLVWSFDEAPDWRPRLELEMSGDVANRYLQGRESLAIAIARGQVRCRGESRAALAYLPAARLICEPYRRVIEAGFPDLVAA